MRVCDDDEPKDAQPVSGSKFAKTCTDVDGLPGSSKKFKLAALLSLSCFAGVYYKSGAVTAVMILATVFDVVTDVVSESILVPPFHEPRPHEQGHTKDPQKLCPYWPPASISGPTGHGLLAEDIKVPASDNELVLRGWYFAAKEGQDNRKTVIIMNHGAGRDRRAWLRHTPFLNQAGYSCLSFDYSDHGTSDMADGVKAPKGSTLGLRETRDLCRVIRYARARFAGEKLVLMGTSTGAVACFISLATDDFARDNVVCFVAENPFSSIAAVTWDTVVNIACFDLMCKRNRVVFWSACPLILLCSTVTVFVN